MILLLPVLLFFLIQNRKEHFNNLRWKLLVFLVILSAVITIVTISNHGSVSRTQGTFSLFNADFINYIYVQYALLFIGKFAFDTPFILKSTFVALLFIYIGIITFKIIRGKNNTPKLKVTFLFTHQARIKNKLVKIR